MPNTVGTVGFGTTFPGTHKLEWWPGYTLGTPASGLLSSNDLPYNDVFPNPATGGLVVAVLDDFYNINTSGVAAQLAGNRTGFGLTFSGGNAHMAPTINGNLNNPGNVAPFGRWNQEVTGWVSPFDGNIYFLDVFGYDRNANPPFLTVPGPATTAGQLGGGCIRKINPVAQTITTFCGASFNELSLTNPTTTNGGPTVATFSAASAMCISSSGTIFVVDSTWRNVRAVDTSGNVTAVAGDSTGLSTTLPVDPDGTAGPLARFTELRGVAVNQTSGDLYVVDDNTVRRIVNPLAAPVPLPPPLGVPPVTYVAGAYVAGAFTPVLSGSGSQIRFGSDASHGFTPNTCALALTADGSLWFGTTPTTEPAMIRISNPTAGVASTVVRQVSAQNGAVGVGDVAWVPGPAYGTASFPNFAVAGYQSRRLVDSSLGLIMLGIVRGTTGGGIGAVHIPVRVLPN